MSPRDPSERSDALDALVAEAKEHLAPPELDWSRLEASLMAEVAMPEVRSLDRTAAALGMTALAAAAAVALFVQHAPEPGPVQHVAVAAQGRSAGAFRGTIPSGAPVEIGAAGSKPGQIVRAGDIIEVTGARALFDRDAKVAWMIEPNGARADARARIAHVGAAPGEPLVLDLEAGAIEAQVTPIPAGEAFAVDVVTDEGSVRVAVHGTHLRVARAGTKVVVDLTEGVIAIGLPSAGITQGTTVRAPAHVELDARDLGTLRIRDTSVRAAIPLVVGAEAPAAETARGAVSLAPGAASLALGEGASAAATPAPVATSARHPVETAPSIAPPAPTPPAPPPSPRETIGKAVRDCAAAQHPRGASEVHVTVSSTLRIKPLATGQVLAIFDPPLPPAIQTCAAGVIHATKFDETEPFSIPIEFSY